MSNISKIDKFETGIIELKENQLEIESDIKKLRQAVKILNGRISKESNKKRLEKIMSELLEEKNNHKEIKKRKRWLGLF